MELTLAGEDDAELLGSVVTVGADHGNGVSGRAHLVSRIAGPQEIGQRELDEIGFSAGAYRTLALARRGRIGVRSFVAVAGLAHADDADRSAVPGVAALVASGSDVVGPLCSIGLSPAGQKDPVFVAQVAESVAATTPPRIVAELGAVLNGPDLRGVLASLGAPVLFRAGTLDPSLHRTEAMAAALPSAPFERAPGMSHWLWIEDFEATSRSIAAFLATLPR